MKPLTYRWYRWSIPKTGIAVLETGSYVYAPSAQAAQCHGDDRAMECGQHHLDLTDVKVRAVKAPPREWTRNAFHNAVIAERAAIHYRNHLGSLLCAPNAEPVPHLP